MVHFGRLELCQILTDFISSRSSERANQCSASTEMNNDLRIPLIIRISRSMTCFWQSQQLKFEILLQNGERRRSSEATGASSMYQNRSMDIFPESVPVVHPDWDQSICPLKISRAIFFLHHD